MRHRLGTFRLKFDVRMFEYVMGAGWIGVGGRYLYGAQDTPLSVIEDQMKWLAPAWGGLLVIGGIALLVALTRAWQPLYVFALWLMGTAYFTIGIALSVGDPNTRVGLYYVMASACVYCIVCRGVVIFQGDRE